MKDRMKMLAVLVSMRRAQSPRRHLKRALRDSGFESTGAALDDLLNSLDALPATDRAQVERIADDLDRAAAAGDGGSPPPPPGHNDWLIAENIAGDRMFIVYHGVNASFIGEVFERGRAPAGWESAPLTEGRVLSHIAWQGDALPVEERHRLYTKGRQALRAYHARRDLYQERTNDA